MQVIGRLSASQEAQRCPWWAGQSPAFILWVSSLAAVQQATVQLCDQSLSLPRLASFDNRDCSEPCRLKEGTQPLYDLRTRPNPRGPSSALVDFFHAVFRGISISSFPLSFLQTLILPRDRQTNKQTNCGDNLICSGWDKCEAWNFANFPECVSTFVLRLLPRLIRRVALCLQWREGVLDRLRRPPGGVHLHFQPYSMTISEAPKEY